jgi:dihydrodipicolinate synthase/N-acetylneuraminate lyase
MSTQQSAVAKRAQWFEQLFPNGVPDLWCPPLTHYRQDGAIDEARIRAHLRHLSRSIGGFLIPGSTGDGWEMSPEEIRNVLEIGIDEAERLRVHVLIGVLKTNAEEVSVAMKETLGWLQSRSERNVAGEQATTVAPPVYGFTVCPPRGDQLSQQEISRALSGILELGLPTAIYQLPQVSRNEISAEVAAGLAQRFPNFLFFKDSSGADRVALAAARCSGKHDRIADEIITRDLPGVFTMRGAEGGYAGWVDAGGGPYKGFLLGSANCFAAELHQILQDLKRGRLETAKRLSERVTAVVMEVAMLVTALPTGNAFANANKALDHFFAWGPGATEVPPPRIRGQSVLPSAIIRATGDSLARHELMPKRGYLDRAADPLQA